MSLDQQLPDLLRDAATGADAAPPTEPGLRAAIGRRRARRRRVATAGTGVFVVACIAAGAVLATSGDDASPPTATDPPAVGELPTVGLDLPGYERIEPVDDRGASRDLAYAVFTDGSDDPLGPVVTVYRHEGLLEVAGDLVDLDADGRPDASVVRRARTGFTWRDEIGWISVGGMGVPEEELIAYVLLLQDEPFALEELPSPAGLPDQNVVRFGPTASFDQQRVSYRGPDAVIDVVTTDAPGWFDLARVNGPSDPDYQAIPLGDSFLGPGVAIFSIDDTDAATALVRTDAGLTVMATTASTTSGDAADAIRQAVIDGAFMTLDDSAPPSTTSPPTTLGAVIDMSGDDLSVTVIDGRLQPPPGNASYAEVRRFDDEGRTRFEVRFRPAAGGDGVVWDDSSPHVEQCADVAPVSGRYVTVLTSLDAAAGLDVQGPVVRSGERIGLVFCTGERWSVFYVPAPEGVEPVIDETHPSRVEIDLPT